jgi:hypothetical protein
MPSIYLSTKGWIFFELTARVFLAFQAIRPNDIEFLPLRRSQDIPPLLHSIHPPGLECDSDLLGRQCMCKDIRRFGIIKALRRYAVLDGAIP